MVVPDVLPSAGAQGVFHLSFLSKNSLCFVCLVFLCVCFYFSSLSNEQLADIVMRPENHSDFQKCWSPPLIAYFLILKEVGGHPSGLRKKTGLPEFTEWERGTIKFKPHANCFLLLVTERESLFQDRK